jgi:hypothetical protein
LWKASDIRQAGEVRLSHLKQHVERTIRGQTPQFFAHAGSGDPLISRGALPLLDKDVLNDLSDNAWRRRLGAVMDLTNIIERGLPRQSQAARTALSARRPLERDVSVRRAIDDALKLEESNFAVAPREIMLRGVIALANAVKVTLGPKGRMVVIGKSGGSSRHTKSGVLIAKEFALRDRFEDMKARFVREAALQTDAKAGDGTTTAIVLAQAILVEAVDAIAAGFNPMDLRRAIEQAVAKVIEEIKALSKSVAANAEIAQIATLSANSDSEAGADIAEAMSTVGNDGPVVVQETENSETKVEVVAGTRFDCGYIRNEFVTSDEKMLWNLITPISWSVIKSFLR